MAFKRKTKRGSGGNRTTTTTHNDGTGFSRSYSSSSTGEQKTGSGGTRTTTTIRSDGRITKTTTRHGANGYISRKSKTTGGSKQPKKIRAKLSTPKYKSPRMSNPFSRGRSSSGRRHRATNYNGTGGDPVALIGVMVIFAVIYLLFVYWYVVVALLVAGIIAFCIWAYNKANNKAIEKQKRIERNKLEEPEQEPAVEQQQIKKIKKSDDELTTSEAVWGLMGIGLVASLIAKLF